MNKKLIYSLISISVSLLFLNIAAEYFLKNSATPIGKAETTAEIEKKFLSVLNTFALKPEWIMRKSIRTGQDEILYYKILIPQSIKTPILLNEITALLGNTTTKIEAREKSIGGNVDLMIYNESKLGLKVKVIYDENIERDVSTLALIMLCNGIAENEIEEIKSQLPVYHLLIPLNVESRKLSAVANILNMEYSVLLNDDISSEFEIDESENKKMILMQIRKIFENFPSAEAFIIDQNSSIYSSKIFPLVKSEFQAKEKKLIPKRNIHSLEEKNYEEQVSLIHYYYTKYTNQDVQNIIIDGNDLLALQNEVYKAQLKGHQFVRPEFSYR